MKYYAKIMTILLIIFSMKNNKIAILAAIISVYVNTFLLFYLL